MISPISVARALVVCLPLVALAACAPPEFEQLKAVSARSLTTLLVEEDFDEWSAFYQPGARLNGSDLAVTVMKSYARGLHYAFPDMTIKVIEQIAADNRVVTHFAIQGTHKGAFSALPPSNRYVELEGVAIDQFQDDLIISTRLMLDISRLTSSLAGGSPRSN
jgi:predicted ester cyclase